MNDFVDKSRNFAIAIPTYAVILGMSFRYLTVATLLIFSIAVSTFDVSYAN